MCFKIFCIIYLLCINCSYALHDHSKSSNLTLIEEHAEHHADEHVKLTTNGVLLVPGIAGDFFNILVWGCRIRPKPYYSNIRHLENARWRGNNILIIIFLGSGLFATLDNAHLPECSDHPISTSRFRLWASLLQALPPASHQRCWARKLSLDWDIPQHCRLRAARYTWSDSSSLSYFFASWWPSWPFSPKLDCESHYLPIEGVQIDVDSPGLTHGFDYLDYVEGIGVYGTKYFHDLISMFKVTGYVEGDTLIGHPFDWRYPLWQLDYEGLKNTIEQFVQRHPDKKVVIIAHSLGIPLSATPFSISHSPGAAMTNFFLTRVVNADWKAKHIEMFVPVAGAFGGSHKAIRSLLSG